MGREIRPVQEDQLSGPVQGLCSIYIAKYRNGCVYPVASAARLAGPDDAAWSEDWAHCGVFAWYFVSTFPFSSV